MNDNGRAQSPKQVPKETYPQGRRKAGKKVSPQRDKAPHPTAFDYQFRRRVLPELQIAADRLAWAIHHGAGFAEALDILIAIALARGAAKLSDLDGLIDYLTEYLTHSVETQP